MAVRNGWRDIADWVIALVVLLGATLPSEAQAWRTVVTQPTAGAVVGWGDDPPTLSLEALLEQDGRPARPERLFMTAVVRRDGWEERVPLYDDGSHGDEQTGDGRYGGRFAPPEPGPYTVTVRAFWAAGREQWSEPAPVTIEPIPYPHVLRPVPGDAVRPAATLEVVLLQQGEPYSDAAARVDARVEHGGEVSTVALARRPGQPSRATAKLEFDTRGEHRIQVYTTTQREGVTLNASADPFTVDVSQPPVFWLVVGGILLLLYLILPPRGAVPLYQHRLQLQGAAGSSGAGELVSLGTESVTRPLGGKDGLLGDQVPNRVATVTAEPGKRSLVVTATGGSLRLPNQGSKAVASAAVEPLASGRAFSIGDRDFGYALKSVGQHRFSRLAPNTLLRWMCLVAALATLGVGLWQWWVFVRNV